ncbi:MAG TPA: glucoamylase family protein, partial [Flavisolibacter sp.]|nr:glucoamylase family protein [Flavisolibacter sp.]
MRLPVSFLMLFLIGCTKKDSPLPIVPDVVENFSVVTITVNGVFSAGAFYGVSLQPQIRVSFSAPVKRSTATSILLNAANGGSAAYDLVYQNGDSVVLLQPSTPLAAITQYNLTVSSSVQSERGNSLQSNSSISFVTAINSSDKFPRITDDELLTLVQRQTFKYFWDFAHPVSGLARERNTSGDLVTSGGSGLGVMALVTGINRQFITRADGLQRMQKIVAFLKNTAQTFHGAYPHWLNGATGVVIPFSADDDGADLVETSYLIQGLLTARQYFSGSDAGEMALRDDINFIWRRVEWSWFRKGAENVLYWHWSPGKAWAMNLQVRGWNECLITYVLAAASPDYAILKAVYDEGWARNGAMKNGASYFGVTLPLGPDGAGPLFFAHYSFLGVNPNSLTDAYANYETQNKAHSKINYNYCVANPKGWYGYNDSCWGLTASDIPNGYAASSPANDFG